jgi:hypothetical protein
MLSPEQAAALADRPYVKPARSTKRLAFFVFIIGLLGLVGLFSALMGISAIIRDIRFQRDDLKVTEGRVVRIAETRVGWGGGRPSADLPVVRFEADDGPYEIYGRVGPYGYYKIGQQVKVLYPPENPRLGRMKGQTSGIDRTYNSYVAAIGGSAFVVAVLAIVWLLKRRARLATPNG